MTESTIATKEKKRDGIIKLAQAFEMQEVSALLIYQSALLVYEEYSSKISIDDENDKLSIRTLFQSVLTALPRSLLRSILGDINQAFILLSSKLSNTSEPLQQQDRIDLQKAVHALIGIYTTSPLACQLGIDTNLCVALVEYYENNLPKTKTQIQIQHQTESQKVLKVLSFLFLDGLLQTTTTLSAKGDEDEIGENGDENSEQDLLLNNIMETVQILQNYSETCLGDLQLWQRNQKTPLSLIDSIQQKFDTHDIRTDYLVDMLRSCPTHDEYVKKHKQQNIEKKKQNASTSSSFKNQKSSKSVKDPIIPLIQQVQSVYPNLGEGYIEVALACYNFDPSILISNLSSSSALHPRLRGIDPKLPRQSRKAQQYNPGLHEDNEGHEARQRQKQFLSNMMDQEEQKNYILSSFMEYNDDYDDQYDGIGNDGKVGAGNMDETVWEKQDYESVKLYNAFVKDEVAEKEYWKHMENQNRKGNRDKGKQNQEDNVNSDEDSEGNDPSNKRWGPDKGKGGRIIGPDGKYLPFPKKGNRKKKAPVDTEDPSNNESSNKTKGGKKNNTNKKKGGSHGSGGKETQNDGNKGNGNSGTSKNSQMSKIQKRRKNDNKAKIANHNRKDRATRKTGGM